MITHHAIQATPPAERQIHSLLAQREIRHVAREYFDLLGAVLVVQGVEGGVRPGDEDEFVGAREEVMGG
jgi:hypothetical protein